MEYRTMKHGETPSLLGFGCMRFPTLADGSIDEEKAEALLDHAIENGVTYIDTAYPYHNRMSEPFVGKVLKKYNRDAYYLATKLPLWDVKTLDDVKEMFQKQLDRLDPVSYTHLTTSFMRTKGQRTATDGALHV